MIKQPSRSASRFKIIDKDLAILFFSIFAIVLGIGLIFRTFYKTDSKKINEVPCPLPDGSYKESCLGNSQPMLADYSNNIPLCNFTVICDTGAGKKYGRQAITLHAYGQYGEECPKQPLRKQEFYLPTYTQYNNLNNERGKITHEDLNRRIPSNMASDFNDDNCTIRQQFSEATIEKPSVVTAALATVVLLGMQ